MKRAADPSSEPSPKRVKESSQGSPEELASLFDDDKQQIYISNLRDGTDGSGFLQGKVHMIWSLGKKQHILLETNESSVGKTLVRVDIFFQGRCAEILKERQVQLGVHDEIQLALRGARVEKKELRSRSSYDIMLKYSEGAQLKFLRRKRESDNLGVVDTWYIPVAQESVPQEEDWFDPPASPTLECAPKSSKLLNLPSITPFHEPVAVPPPSTPPEPERIVIKSESPEPDLQEPKKPLFIQEEHKLVKHSETLAHINNPQLMVTDPPEAAPTSGAAAAEKAPVPPLPSKKLSKKERKKLRMVGHHALLQKQREMLESEQQKSSTNGISPDGSGSPQENAAQPTAEASPEVATVEDVATVSVTASSKPSLPPAEPAAPNPINMKAGRKTRYTNFSALADIKAPATCTVAGIVVSLPQIITTRNGDLSCTIKIVDPSNCKMEDDSYRQAPKYSTTVPCFTQKYSKWLPSPTIGDVVILKDVKVSNWHGGINLTGYKDKLQWAIYSSKEQKIHHGDISDIPHDERLREGGYGHLHTPFYQPRDVDEVLYCQKLLEWWDAIEKERERFMSTIINLGGEDGQPIEAYHREARPNWMMKDVKASNVSNGYFDTTVEVVFRSKPQDNDRFSLLFVTDYTENDGFEPFNNSVVHNSLSKSIARLECWDASSKVAAQFTVGDYLSLKNVKCRVNNLGSYELKMQEPKLFLLKDTDATHNVALGELLKRKKAHQDEHGSNDPAELEYRLLKNVDLGGFSSFVVEILHIANSTDSVKSCLYVSDFTHNPILQGTRLVSKLPQTLDGRVLRVLLYDGHMELGKKLGLGDIISIRKARITKSYADNEVNMKLGGNDVRITRLIPGVDSYKPLIEQVKRQKADWEASVTDPSVTNSLKAARRDSHGQEPLTPTTPRLLERTLNVSAEPPQKRKRLHHTPVKEVLAVKSFPERFRIYARIVDFFPTVQEFVYRSCSRCRKDIPPNQRACVSCNDSDHEYVELQYRFWLKLEDEDGMQITVSVADYSPVVREFPRADLAEDKDAYATVCRLLDVFFGNTRMYLEEHLAGKDAVLSSPLLCCLVINAQNMIDEMVYTLVECTLA